jgi:hypothetical protein
MSSNLLIVSESPNTNSVLGATQSGASRAGPTSGRHFWGRQAGPHRHYTTREDGTSLTGASGPRDGIPLATQKLRISFNLRPTVHDFRVAHTILAHCQPTLPRLTSYLSLDLLTNINLGSTRRPENQTNNRTRSPWQRHSNPRRQHRQQHQQPRRSSFPARPSGTGQHNPHTTTHPTATPSSSQRNCAGHHSASRRDPIRVPLRMAMSIRMRRGEVRSRLAHGYERRKRPCAFMGGFRLAVLFGSFGSASVW